MSRNDLLFVLLCAAIVGAMASESARPERLFAPPPPDLSVSRNPLAALPELDGCNLLTADRHESACASGRLPNPGGAKIVMSPFP